MSFSSILFSLLFGISIYVGDNVHEIGTPEFLHSFYSTIAVRLEGGKWGSRFPVLMNELSKGKLESKNAAAALRELAQVLDEMKELPPQKLVWSFEDRNAKAPWGDAYNHDVGTLDDCFMTAEYKSLLKVLRQVLELSKKQRETVYVQ